MENESRTFIRKREKSFYTKDDIVELLLIKIANGDFNDSQLPTVRELALEQDIEGRQASRVYGTLERQEIITPKGEDPLLVPTLTSNGSDTAKAVLDKHFRGETRDLIKRVLKLNGGDILVREVIAELLPEPDIK